MYLNSAGESTNSSTHFHSTPNTSLNLDSATSIEANSRKLTPSTYKGVIPQPNGRWGAQIYEKHNRVWLGTFNTEHEAAKAYDVAAKRFKGPYAITNMKQHEHNDIELAFLNMHSKENIVDMLRKHTYHQELEKGKKNIVMHHPSKFGPNLVGSHASQSPRVHLFDKVLTPSDVGRLNRLVIPKQHAENHFPKNSEKTSLKDVFLSFEDAQGKVWRFRYSYWDSSQSYVLTKGWIHFVKEKGLKAGDVVRFDRSADDDKRLYIDYKVSNELKVKHAEPVKIVKLFGVNVCKCRRE